MAKAVERKIRLSQTITPFGVGAIYDILGESLVACDTQSWRSNKSGVIDAPRLAEHLRVKDFRIPPAGAGFSVKTVPPIMYTRFPKWLFCPSCRGMVYWKTDMEKVGTYPVCRQCSGSRQLVPMRFIMICEDGHMGDVPWDYWAHWGANTPHQKQCKSQNLEFLSEAGKGSGLAGLRIRCRECNASRSLDRVLSKETLKAMNIRCSGKQPWQRPNQAEACACTPLVVQRGASNVYFPYVSSAIDIPPQSNFDYYADTFIDITNHEMYPLLRTFNGDSPVRSHVLGVIADGVGVSVAEVETALQRDNALTAGSGGNTGGGDVDDILSGEWAAFLQERSDYDARDRFITKHVNLFDFQQQKSVTAHAELGCLIDKVVVAKRIREVRALAGFSRVKPVANTFEEEGGGRLIRPDMGKGFDWLPAIEVYGEGIFFTLNEARLQDWENNPDVIKRARQLEAKRTGSFYGALLPHASPRFLLIHTLSHLMIRQLAFDAGYSSTSLRERIYCQTPDKGESRAGIFIYTAAGDAEGTLGGLARLGEPPRLARTLISALQTAQWCSNDPICMESNGQGVDGLNLGACHACSLVSETSCTFFNLFLDRSFVIGGLGEIPGFFNKVLELSLGEESEESR